MKTRSILTVMSAVILAGILSGCNAQKPKGSFRLSQRRITIHTQPSGAAVIQQRPLNQGYTTLGMTPINDLSVSVITHLKMKNMPLGEALVLMKHGGNVVVIIQKEGYETHYATLKTDPQETLVHTIELQPKEVQPQEEGQ